MKRIFLGLAIVSSVGIAIRADGPGPATNADALGEQLRTLRKSAEHAEEELYRLLDEAKTEQLREELWAKYRSRIRDLVTRAIEIARLKESDPAVVDVLLWIHAQRIPDLSEESRKILMRHHVENPKMIDACRHTLGVPPADFASAERLLREVSMRNPDRLVKAVSTLYLAEHLLQWSDTVQFLGNHADRAGSFIEDAALLDQINSRNREKLSSEAEGLLCRIVESYADVETPEERRLAEVARGKLFGIRRLRLGKVAPEITGTDAYGKEIRLSEFRGKVILLTFSGNWCSPCRELYPKERELVRKLKDRPFAHLSINTDDQKETLRRSIESGEITWRCWWDGAPGEGPIVKLWGVSGLPTSFILDHRGVIRHKQVLAEELDGALEPLLIDAEMSVIQRK
jgi:peroxiredoxin